MNGINKVIWVLKRADEIFYSGSIVIRSFCIVKNNIYIQNDMDAISRWEKASSFGKSTSFKSQKPLAYTQQVFLAWSYLQGNYLQGFCFCASQNLKLSRYTCFCVFISSLIDNSVMVKSERMALSNMWTSAFPSWNSVHIITTSLLVNQFGVLNAIFYVWISSFCIENYDRRFFLNQDTCKYGF